MIPWAVNSPNRSSKPKQTKRWHFSLFAPSPLIANEVILNKETASVTQVSGPISTARGRRTVVFGRRLLILKPRILGSGMVAGKVLMVDHM